VPPRECHHISLVVYPFSFDLKAILEDGPGQFPDLGGAPQAGFKQFPFVDKFFGQEVKKIVKKLLMGAIS
jgi:hypothetical protein